MAELLVAAVGAGMVVLLVGMIIGGVVLIGGFSDGDLVAVGVGLLILFLCVTFFFWGALQWNGMLVSLGLEHWIREKEWIDG